MNTELSTLALLVVGGFQAAFIVAMLAFLGGVHRKGRRGSVRETAAIGTLRGPIRALVMGEDHGESLAAALGRLDPASATRQLLSIATSQLAPEQRRDIALLVRPSSWVNGILEAGTSRRWWKRMRAARLLAVVNSPADLPLLTDLVTDPHPAVVGAATGAIVGPVDAGLIETIIRGLAGQPTAVRLQQMRALRTHIDVAAPTVIAHLDEGPEPEQMRALVQLAEVLATPAVLAAIVPLADHDDGEVRATVARALRSCFMPIGVETAQRMLTDTDWRVRSAAARALGALGAMEAIPDLMIALRDEWWWVRFRAALALGSLGVNGAAALAAATDSNDPFARDMAVVVSGLSESARLELST